MFAYHEGAVTNYLASWYRNLFIGMGKCWQFSFLLQWSTVTHFLSKEILVCTQRYTPTALYPWVCEAHIHTCIDGGPRKLWTKIWKVDIYKLVFFFLLDYMQFFSVKEFFKRGRKLAGSASFCARKALRESPECPCSPPGRGLGAHAASPPLANLFVPGVSGQSPVHCIKFNYRINLARIQMLVPMPHNIASPCVFSNLPYDVTAEQALTYPEVKSKLDASNESLRRVTDKVLNSIISSLDLLP